jgi:hypothetical protein
MSSTHRAWQAFVITSFLLVARSTHAGPEDFGFGNLVVDKPRWLLLCR